MHHTWTAPGGVMIDLGVALSEGWTADQVRELLQALLREHDRRFEQKFADLEVRITAALNAAQRANDKSEQAQERRNETMNEFRGQQADILRTTMPRGEADAQFKNILERLDTSSLSLRNDMERRFAESDVRLRSIERAASNVEGISVGKAAAMASAIALVFLILAVAGFLVANQ